MTSAPTTGQACFKPRGQTVTRARGLRRQMSLPEVLLWKALRRRSHGLKFRRQHPIGPFVLDFYCAEIMLAVEVDGAGHAHDDAKAYDARRDRWLVAQRIRVVRVPAQLVLKDVEAAVETILEACG